MSGYWDEPQATDTSDTTTRQHRQVRERPTDSGSRRPAFTGSTQDNVPHMGGNMGGKGGGGKISGGTFGEQSRVDRDDGVEDGGGDVGDGAHARDVCDVVVRHQRLGVPVHLAQPCLQFS